MAGNPPTTGREDRYSYPTVAPGIRETATHPRYLGTIHIMRSSDRLVRVVVGDGHTLYREGAVATLAASGFVDIMAEAEDGPSTLEAIRTHRPDVALLDEDLDGLGGLAVARQVQREELDTQLLILASFSEADTVRRALQEGVGGYLSKISLYADIVDAVLDVASGHTVVPPELRLQPTPLSERDFGFGEPLGLTARERKVLTAIAAGQPVPSIARQLALAPTGVQTQVRHACAKLGVPDRAAAVAEAARRGLLG